MQHSENMKGGRHQPLVRSVVVVVVVEVVTTYFISLITGWTVYTEKYKARGLYEGPRDLYFSYRQSNQEFIA